MTVTINITSASEVDARGRQKIAFEVVHNKKTIVEHTIEGDVDELKDLVLDFIRDFKEKYSSQNKYKTGDSYTIEV